MDVLVEWEDNRRNIVATSELECVDGKTFREGQRVRMRWKKKYYYGTVKEIIETVSPMIEEIDSDDLPLESVRNMSGKTGKFNSSRENKKTKETKNVHIIGLNSDSEDDLPLSYITQNKEKGKLQVTDYAESDSHHDSESPFYDSDKDPPYFPDSHVKNCEVSDCQVEVFSSCHICQHLLCYNHFVNMGPCDKDHKIIQPNIEPLSKKKKLFSPRSMTMIPIENLRPEDFVVEGSEREKGAQPHKVKQGGNIRKDAHESRIRGEEYVSPKTGKTVHGRNYLKPKCSSIRCSSMGKKCSSFSEEEREDIIKAYYRTGSLQLQREFIVRFVQKTYVKQTTVIDHVSRRSNTLRYHLPKDGVPVPVCKIMFLNTLNISEKTLRTALAKNLSTGIVEKEMRGGRHASFLELDKIKKNAILEHINRFPRMESHYIRHDSKREYLHPNLNKQMMYEMFMEEYSPKGISVSSGFYRAILKTQNLSFHNPKKDLCKICETYRTGDKEKKNELEELYQQHIKNKEAVRTIKDKAKHETDDDVAVAVFDLQQVIYLPQTNDNQLFYKRRLANYNLTVYVLKSRECHCYTWHEGVGKRGSSEIGTCLKMYLEHLDRAGIKEVILFADGCPGQNKNSIIATVLLHSVNRMDNIKQISLHYFEAYHGQSEGDSAHSAIKTALDNAGDLYVPSQLVPVFRLARRKNPYCVHTPQTADFLDFKSLSKDLRVLTIRSDDQGGTMDWTKVTTLMVKKTDGKKIFFKSSHLQEEYRSLTLKQRLQGTDKLQNLYTQAPKISKDKYEDLVSLCEGAFPVIRVTYYRDFFKSLPH